MAGTLRHLRSATLDKRPNPASMVDGQVAINYADGSPGLFFKDSNGDLVKVGPVHVGSTAPNATPAGGGTAGNSVGEQWLDTSGSAYVFKIWDGSAWRSEAGEFVNATGDTMTGALVLPSGTEGAPALGVGSADNGLYSPGEDQVAISTNGQGRLFIDSSGRLLVGTSSSLGNDSTLQVVNDSSTSIELFRGQNLRFGPACLLSKSRGSSALPSAVNANDEMGTIAFRGYDGSSFINSAFIFAEVDGTPSANDMPGRLVFSTTADGASSPTERMRITSGGDLLHGITTLFDQNTSSGSGVRISDGGYAFLMRSAGAPLFLNRNTNDGELVDFRQGGVKEGSISVSGTTVSYNGAHLSRLSQIPGIDPYNKAVRPEILRGTVMSNLDEMCDWTCPTSGDCQDNEQLNKTKISDVEGDKNVAGIFQSWDDDDDTWVNDFYLAMTGDFVIRIAAGTTVERGDLLMSAGDGTAKPQGDDIIRSKTVAKVTSTHVTCTYEDGSYCVPCVLMAC